MENTFKLLQHENSRLIAIEALLDNGVKDIRTDLETLYLGYVSSKMADDLGSNYNVAVGQLFCTLNNFFISVNPDIKPDREFLNQFQLMHDFIVQMKLENKFKAFESASAKY